MTAEIETFIKLKVDAITGVTSECEMTSEEVAEIMASRAQKLIDDSEAQAKVDARQSALAKLAAIGLTQEEIEAL
jgi:DNA-binding NarL/FixJ family response regulator